MHYRTPNFKNPSFLEIIGRYPKSFFAFLILYRLGIFTNDRSNLLKGGAVFISNVFHIHSRELAMGMAINPGRDFVGCLIFNA